VESQQVVPIKTSAADGDSTVETTMRPMPVVVMKPGKELGITFLRVEIGAGVDPLAESGLDKPFGLAIGAGSVRTGEMVTEAECHDSSAESVRAITVAVVGEQAADGDAEGSIVSHGSPEESNSGSSGESGQDLGKGNAGMVIDGDVEVLPSAVMLSATTAIEADLDVGEASQLLDIQVQ